MKALTALDEHRRATRRPQRRSELLALLAQGTDPQEAEASLDRVLEALQAQEVSFLQRGEGADPEVDISHEALIRGWRRLSGPDRDFRTGWVADEAYNGLQYRWLHEHVAGADTEPVPDLFIGW